MSSLELINKFNKLNLSTEERKLERAKRKERKLNSKQLEQPEQPEQPDQPEPEYRYDPTAYLNHPCIYEEKTDNETIDFNECYDSDYLNSSLACNNYGDNSKKNNLFLTNFNNFISIYNNTNTNTLCITHDNLQTVIPYDFPFKFNQFDLIKFNLYNKNQKLPIRSITKENYKYYMDNLNLFNVNLLTYIIKYILGNKSRDIKIFIISWSTNDKFIYHSNDSDSLSYPFLFESNMMFILVRYLLFKTAYLMDDYYSFANEPKFLKLLTCEKIKNEFALCLNL
jgi:hypothetical protein